LAHNKKKGDGMDPRYKSPTAEVVDRYADDEFRDLTTFTTVLAWMLRAGAALAFFGLLASWMQLELLSRSFSAAEGSANAQRVVVIAGLAGLLRVVTWFVFGRWIVLAHRNLPALGERYPEFTPGWAVGWFFIPFANLWKPFQAMRDLWRSSHSVHRREIQPSTWVLPTWWTLWLAFAFLSNISQQISRGAHGLDDYRNITQFALVSGVFDVSLSVVASILVTRIWRAQEQQHDNPEEAPKGFADLPSTAANPPSQ
jgi:hypothetical protein